MKNYDKLTINSEIFNKAREDFNTILQKTVEKMSLSNNTQADISMTMSIDIYDKYITDDGVLRDAYSKPIIEHKVSSVIKQKSEKKGLSDGEYILKWDDDSKFYIIKNVEDVQTNLTDNINDENETPEIANENTENPNDDVIVMGGASGVYMLNDYSSDEKDKLLSAV
ncbi:MAG: hypothetical protein K0S55_1648 [Clostridia bacterium]|jgi:hypothetical protein|nr:hypothetical protein [Clostridia bacterium]